MISLAFDAATDHLFICETTSANSMGPIKEVNLLFHSLLMITKAATSGVRSMDTLDVNLREGGYLVAPDA